jgi:arylsulfatase A-like enzyme
MLWVFPEYGGQVAVRIGDFKIIRQGLQTPKKTGPWQVFDLKHDPSEKTDLAADQPALIAQAIAVLKREVAPNPIFQMPIPGVTE